MPFLWIAVQRYSFFRNLQNIPTLFSFFPAFFFDFVYRRRLEAYIHTAFCMAQQAKMFSTTCGYQDARCRRFRKKNASSACPRPTTHLTAGQKSRQAYGYFSLLSVASFGRSLQGAFIPLIVGTKLRRFPRLVVIIKLERFIISCTFGMFFNMFWQLSLVSLRIVPSRNDSPCNSL